MTYIPIFLVLLFSSQSIASNTSNILTKREITFNNQLVLKLYLENNGAKLINKFSNVCNTFNATKGVVEEDFAGYRKSHGLTSGIGLNFYGNDSDSCLSAFEGWQHYQNFSWGACNMAKATGDGKHINNCEKWGNKESSFFGYLELLTTKATDIINAKRLVQVDKEQNERLEMIEARKKSLAKNKRVATEIIDKKSKNCISELDNIYTLDKAMLASLNEPIERIERFLKANLIADANKILKSMSIDKPLILTGNDFCLGLPDYRSKYDEINKDYSEITHLIKSYNTKIQAKIVNRARNNVAQKKKTQLSVRNPVQLTKTHQKPTDSINQPYIKEGSLFCSTKAQFDEQMTWLAQGIREFITGCGASMVNIPVIVLDTSLFRGAAKVKGIRNKMIYYVAMESLNYP
jgi:hypothetical protein